MHLRRGKPLMWKMMRTSDQGRSSLADTEPSIKSHNIKISDTNFPTTSDTKNSVEDSKTDSNSAIDIKMEKLSSMHSETEPLIVDITDESFSSTTEDKNLKEGVVSIDEDFWYQNCFNMSENEHEKVEKSIEIQELRSPLLRLPSPPSDPKSTQLSTNNDIDNEITDNLVDQVENESTYSEKVVPLNNSIVSPRASVISPDNNLEINQTLLSNNLKISNISNFDQQESYSSDKFPSERNVTIAEFYLQAPSIPLYSSSILELHNLDNLPDFNLIFTSKEEDKTSNQLFSSASAQILDSLSSLQQLSSSKLENKPLISSNIIEDISKLLNRFILCFDCVEQANSIQIMVDSFDGFKSSVRFFWFISMFIHYSSQQKTIVVVSESTQNSSKLFEALRSTFQHFLDQINKISTLNSITSSESEYNGIKLSKIIENVKNSMSFNFDLIDQSDESNCVNNKILFMNTSDFEIFGLTNSSKLENVLVIFDSFEAYQNHTTSNITRKSISSASNHTPKTPSCLSNANSFEKYFFGDLFWRSVILISNLFPIDKISSNSTSTTIPDQKDQQEQPWIDIGHKNDENFFNDKFDFLESFSHFSSCNHSQPFTFGFLKSMIDSFDAKSLLIGFSPFHQSICSIHCVAPSSLLIESLNRLLSLENAMIEVIIQQELSERPKEYNQLFNYSHFQNLIFDAQFEIHFKNLSKLIRYFIQKRNSIPYSAPIQNSFENSIQNSIENELEEDNNLTLIDDNILNLTIQLNVLLGIFCIRKIRRKLLSSGYSDAVAVVERFIDKIAFSSSLNDLFMMIKDSILMPNFNEIHPKFDSLFAILAAEMNSRRSCIIVSEDSHQAQQLYYSLKRIKDFAQVQITVINQLDPKFRRCLKLKDLKFSISIIPYCSSIIEWIESTKEIFYSKNKISSHVLIEMADFGLGGVNLQQHKLVSIWKTSPNDATISNSVLSMLGSLSLVQLIPNAFAVSNTDNENQTEDVDVRVLHMEDFLNKTKQKPDSKLWSV